MAKTGKPRSGSMQVWPRKRAKRIYANIKAYPKSDSASLLGFAGYKVGMTHVTVVDNSKTSKTKSQHLSIPVTVVEVPPLKILSVRFYKTAPYGKYVSTEVINGKLDKELSRKISLPKKKTFQEKIAEIEKNIDSYSQVSVTVYTSPKGVTALNKKKPEVFENALGGNVKDQLTWVKENIEKEIAAQDVVKEGMFVDIHAITKGKGTQGPVRRFGIGFTSHKSEKARRTPGSLGGWVAQGHTMYRMAFAGQTGYHKRVDYNKLVLKLGTNPEEINVAGGFKGYGLVKNNYVLIKGSIPGPAKRLVRFIPAIRPKKSVSSVEAPAINYVSLSSVQG